jgi:AcrR family transcriptional regulator
MPEPTRQSSARHDLVAQEILDHAAALFAQRGVTGTSLQDIAERLEISRTALYHYVGSKDELLGRLVRGITLETAVALERLARETSEDPAARLRMAVSDMVLRVARDPDRFRLLLMSEAALSDALAAEHRDARRRTLAALSALIHQGILAGAIRPTDERLAAFSVLGMCNWVAWWYRPGHDGGQTPEQLAPALADLAIGGLAETTRAPGDPADIDGLLESLRRQVDLLEMHVSHRCSDPPKRGATLSGHPSVDRRAEGGGIVAEVPSSRDNA